AVLAVSRTAAELLPTSNLRGGDTSASLLQKPALTHVATKCEANCSGHGTCEESGRCACKPGWIGSFCDMPLCPSNCNKRGMCLHGKCLCEAGWHGKACHIQRCLSALSSV
ncbi:Tenm3, partial [Symbiodinium necroappetens]